MTYICLIDCNTSSVPYMEPLLVDDAETALETARHLMTEHASAIAVHVFDGNEQIATFTAEPGPSALPTPGRLRWSGRQAGRLHQAPEGREGFRRR